ncbi:hypothetical protein [Haloferula sp.]|uniref:hypothetical protein n=1 Tax=Haloferula sp. TaxID=2497595 RepID=UPI00329B4C71
MSDEEMMSSRRTGRGGVEVRVIGGGMGDLRRDERRAAGWIEEDAEDAEDVVKLDGGGAPLANRRLEDEEQVAPLPLSRKNRRIGMRGLTVLMAGSAVLIAIVVVSVAMSVRKDPPGRNLGIESMTVIDEGAEVDDLATGHGGQKSLIGEAVELFKEYCEAESVDDVIGMIRKGESLRPILNQKWEPLGRTDNLDGKVFQTENVVGVQLSGETIEGEEFEFVSVLTKEGVKIDWEASLGIGEVEFEELKSVGIGRAVTMRVEMGSSTYYPIEFPDSEFRSYRITAGEGDDAVFGYARVGTDVVAKLSTLLNENSVLLSKVDRLSAIVRIRNEGLGEIGQFVITDIKQVGWIEP